MTEASTTETPRPVAPAVLASRAEQPAGTRAKTLDPSQDPLAAIARGETLPSEVHGSVGEEKPVLEVDNFRLWYGQAQAIYDISMDVPQGKVTALIGPSGCGKSTLLRSVNRLNDLIDIVRIEGDMRLRGDSIYDPGVDVIELRKRMGMVFQKSNPFPMSIYENVVYALRIDGEHRKSVLDEVCEKSLRGAALWDEVKDRLDDLGLGLSGGQQQRLCIARAIAAEPEVLLMDEPCSAPRSHRHRQDRRSDHRASWRIYDSHRHPQYAAGLSRLRLHRVHVPRPDDRVRSHTGYLYQPSPESDRGLYYGSVWVMTKV